MDVLVGAVLGEADRLDRKTLACNGAMDCRWWMSRLVEYWDTHTHRETHMYMMGPWTGGGGCLG